MIHDRRKEKHACSELEKQKQLDMNRLLSFHWQSRRAVWYSLCSSDLHNRISVGSPASFWYPAHLLLELALRCCFSFPRKENALFPMTPSQGWLLPLCVHLNSHQRCSSSSNMEHSHLIFCAVSVVQGCVFKGQRWEHTTRQMMKCYITECREKTTTSGIRLASYKLSHPAQPPPLHLVTEHRALGTEWTEAVNNTFLVTTHEWNGYSLLPVVSSAMVLG